MVAGCDAGAQPCLGLMEHETVFVSRKACGCISMLCSAFDGFRPRAVDQAMRRGERIEQVASGRVVDYWCVQHRRDRVAI